MERCSSIDMLGSSMLAWSMLVASKMEWCSLIGMLGSSSLVSGTRELGMRVVHTLVGNFGCS